MIFARVLSGVFVTAQPPDSISGPDSVGLVLVDFHVMVEYHVQTIYWKETCHAGRNLVFFRRWCQQAGRPPANCWTSVDWPRMNAQVA
jgi:hypothetical protein